MKSICKWNLKENIEKNDKKDNSQINFEPTLPEGFATLVYNS